MAEQSFPTALFGYRKKTVNSYLTSLAQKQLEEQQQTDALLQQHQQQAQAAVDQLHEQQTQWEANRMQMEEDAQTIGRLEEQLASLRQELGNRDHQLECLKSKVAELEHELSGERSVNDGMTRRVADLEYQLARYLEDKVKIADAIINARFIAREIIDSANERAQRARSEICECLDGLANRMDALRSDAGTLQEDTEQTLLQFNERLGSVASDIEGLSSSLQHIVEDTFDELGAQSALSGARR